MPGKIVKDLLCSIRAEIENVDVVRAVRVVIGLGYTIAAKFGGEPEPWPGAQL
ncbi:MAG: hypothetical protein QXS79_05220 [Candidatus Bathyarchaeia archaeon]